MLNLYQVLSRQQVGIVFILVEPHEATEKWLQVQNIEFEIVSESVSGWEATVVKQYHPVVWINDRLNTDIQHVKRLNSLGLKSVSFDDAGNGAQYLDINIAALAPARGQTLQGCKVLTGLEYLILPEEISNFQRVRKSLDKLIVNLGGSDTYGITLPIVNWLQEKQYSATVILGPGFLYEKELERIIDRKLITVKSAVASLVVEFSSFDLAITGGGLTAFEAAAAGLPTLTVANEEHEIAHCLYLQKLGCSQYIGFRKELDLNVFDYGLDVEKMSKVGLNQVQLKGVDKICKQLMALL